MTSTIETPRRQSTDVEICHERGLRDGKAGFTVEACPYSIPRLVAAYNKGHKIGAADRARAGAK